MGLCCVTTDGRAKGLVWALVSGLNCPLCQIGDNKQSVRPSRLPPPARGEATDGTLKQDASVREVNLRRDGVANIMASFIDTDRSDTSKSGPINTRAGGGMTGACEVAAAFQHGDKCLFDLLHRRPGARDAAALSKGLKDGGAVRSNSLLCIGCDMGSPSL